MLQKIEMKQNKHIISCGSFELDYRARTLIMGVLNVTPDSFSDGGLFLDPKDAVEHAIQMTEDGADIIDIGGESTRPGADFVSSDEEMKRVVPVIEALAKNIQVPISIDTRKADVANAALRAGAHMVNDISGLKFDSEMALVVQKYDVPVIIMHSKGLPKSMQNNPAYDNILQEIIESFNESIDIALDSGITRDRIILDPGIGFGKPWKENFNIIAHLDKFKTLGFPILMGVSRKSFIGNALNLSEEKRIFGTAAAVSACVLNGTNIVRVHDIQEMKQVCTIIDHIQSFKN